MKYALVVALLLAGCTAHQTIIKTDTVRVPYGLVDTATLYRIDTVYQAGSERWNVRIDTLWKRVVLRIKDTVEIVRHDTTQVIFEKPPTFWNAWSYWLPALAVGMVLMFVGGLYAVKKFR